MLKAAVEAEEDLLGEVLYAVVRTREAQEAAEDEGLVLSYDGLEVWHTLARGMGGGWQVG